MAVDGRECRGCGAPMIWAKWASGKGVPLDAEPNAEKGNVRFDAETGRAELLAVRSAQEARDQGEPLYTVHFYSCPEAESFRKGR